MGISRHPQMLRVLLNITHRELLERSGDVVLLNDLFVCTADGDAPLRYCTLSGGGLLARDLRRVFWHLSFHWQPRLLRRRLFIPSQRNYIPLSSIPRTTLHLIHTHLFLPWNAAALRKRWPIVFSSEGLSPPEYYNYIGRGLYPDVVAYYNLVGRSVDRIVVWTSSCAERLKQACPAIAPLVEFVPPLLSVEACPTETRTAAPPGKRKTRFLFMGKEPCRKGLREVVRAFLIASRQDKGMELIVRSEGVPRDIVADMAKNSGILFYSEHWPRQRCLEELWKCDVFLLPTHAETLGAVLIEAMARHCAVITSDCAPLNEVAPHGVVGFNVPPGDAASLAEKMLALSQSRPVLGQMQNAARQHYERVYSPQAALPRLIQAYQRAIHHHRQS